jgi:hypothetical protein
MDEAKIQAFKDKALAEGYSEADIQSHIAKLSAPTEPVAQPVDKAKEIRDKALAEGYSEADVNKFLQDKGLVQKEAPVEKPVNTAIPTSMGRLGVEAVSAPVAQPTPQELGDLYKNVYGKYSTTAKSVQSMFDSSKNAEVAKDISDLNQGIVRELTNNNFKARINPEQPNEILVVNDKGAEEILDSSILSQLYNAKTETVGSITGAITGAKAGAALPIPHPLGKVVAAGVGAIAGGMIGGALGSGADKVMNSFELKEKLEGEVLKNQMIEAGIFDGAISVVGGGVLKAGSAVSKSVGKAYRYFKEGNVDGAFESLVDNMQISKTQAEELVKQWETLNAKEAPGSSFQEKAIGVITTTQPGAESYVKVATVTDPKASYALVKDIDARAKGVVNAVKSITDDATGDIIRKDLADYQGAVKSYYGSVVNDATNIINKTEYRFNLDKLAVEPTLQNLGAKITDPTKQIQFANYMSKIDAITTNRTFSGLLELRQTINDFKYAKLTSFDDNVAVNKVINKLDSEIGKAAKEHLPDGSTWVKQFSSAKTEYAKMKSVEENVVFKSLNKEGITEEGVQKVIGRYVNALDNPTYDTNVFNEVMSKLPTKTQNKVEASIIKNITDKYTIGHESGLQAVHFPLLAETLSSYTFKNPESKKIVKAVTDMAAVFKNDPVLANVSGKLSIKENQSYLASSPVGRLKQEVVSQSWNALRKFIPGKSANESALIEKTRALLENPMNVKTVDAYIKELPVEAQAEARATIHNLRAEYVKQNIQPTTKTKLYKVSTNPQLVETNGALGKGLYLTDKIANPKAVGPATGHTIHTQEVDATRLATFETISKLVNKEVTAKDIRANPEIVKTLQSRGYQGINQDGKVMLFPGAAKKKTK